MVEQRHRLADAHDELFIAGVVIEGEQHRRHALRRPQRRHYAQVLGEALCAPEPIAC